MNGVPISIDSFEDIVCECGTDVFIELSKLKLVPALMSPTNQEMPYPYFSTMACAKCGKDIRFAIDAMKNGEEKSNLIL